MMMMMVIIIMIVIIIIIIINYFLPASGRPTSFLGAFRNYE